MDRDFTRSILCSGCSLRQSFANPGPRWHELFPTTKDWREFEYEWKVRKAADEDEEDSYEEDSDEEDSEKDEVDSGNEEKDEEQSVDHKDTDILSRLLTGRFKDANQGEANSRDGSRSSCSKCECDHCLKRARNKIQQTFADYKKNGMLQDFLKLYGIGCDMQWDWVNPAAVAGLFPRVNGFAGWKQHVQVIQLGDPKQKMRTLYSEPLDLQKLAKVLEERQQRPELSKLYEDWDLVIDGKALSEGADASTKVFVHASDE
ncbi:hypothetical protein Rt10032_c05g2260 [Rhodotorula toruloides]|uniref:Uncharacterized protein n=1 Tax=Rhodotorula toruloides TaxID=5286 RepID=A0A511KCZ6_RHOTO|nr:hypothetical protein Rt10032_c05g2260 [Rhodotorula toruloides]